MKEKEEMEKQIKPNEYQKHRRIRDYDSGLLQTIFEDITGSPDDIFNRWCERLIRISARIKNLAKDDEKPDILDKIEAFFTTSELPSITTDVNDYKQNEGRVIDIKTSGKEPFSCTTEIYPTIEKSLREEQYLELTNKVRWLVAEAISVLEKTELTWHRDGFSAINLTKENEDGNSA